MNYIKPSAKLTAETFLKKSVSFSLSDAAKEITIHLWQNRSKFVKQSTFF